MQPAILKAVCSLWSSTHPFIDREDHPFVKQQIMFCDYWNLWKYICWWIELLHFSAFPAVISMVAKVMILLQFNCPVFCWNAFNPDMFSSNVVLYKSEIYTISLNWRLLIPLSMMCEFLFFFFFLLLSIIPFIGCK